MLPFSGKNLASDHSSFFFYFLLFLLLIPPGAKAQIDIKRYTSATDTFYWKKYTHIPKPPRASLRQFTVPGSERIKDGFIERYTGEFDQFSEDSIQRISLKLQKKNLFAIDINGDKLADMVFTGLGEDKSGIVRIWLNRNDGYELVFEDYQYISRFRMEGGKLTEMQTGDVGTGDNYLYFTRDYRVEYENNEPVFIKGKQTVAYKYTEEPIKYFPQPLPFISRADTLLVRASAAQLNEPFNPQLETFGNIVAKYRSGSRGTVLASKSYGAGNDWYFAEFSPAVSPSASILYDIDKIPTFIRGWVSGQGIRIK